MSNTPTPILKTAAALGLFAALTTGAVVLTHQGTENKIADNERAAIQRALTEVLSTKHYDNTLLDDQLLVTHAKLGTDSQQTIYIAKRDQRPSGVVMEVVAPDGYGGAIRLLVGVLHDGTVSGVRVVGTHAETPGLGDAIEASKSDWILSFDGKSLENPTLEGWQVKKDGGEFDQFTGATITPRAVVNAVRRSLELHADEKNRWFEQSQAQALASDMKKTSDLNIATEDLSNGG